MSLLVYHFPISNFSAACRFIVPISPPFNGPTGLTIPGARINQLYTVIDEATGYKILPLLAYFSALCWITMPISPSANGPTGLPFFTILPISSLLQVYSSNYPVAQWP